MTKYYIKILFLLVLFKSFGQEPNFSIAQNNKYIEFKKTIVNNDFYNTAQVKIGTYLTLGNFGNTNKSWIGSNAILDYTSYGGRGSLGSKNQFIPAWNEGMALVMIPSFVDGNFTAYTHSWNNSSEKVDLLDFEPIWNLGPSKSYIKSRLGIGMDNPGQALEIYNPNAFNANMQTENQDHISLISKDPGKGNYFGGITWKSSGRRRASISATREHNDSDYVGLAFFTQGVDGPGPIAESMRITRYGNVGIGTTTPDAKLTVKGNIHTQEVKVDLSGAVAPDYVFKEDYKLKSLQEVETYIKKEGHLPNIPSAEEMEKEGVNLKEMNLKLLEKIEELTLYIIDLRNEVENLKFKIDKR